MKFLSGTMNDEDTDRINAEHDNLRQNVRRRKIRTDKLIAINDKYSTQIEKLTQKINANRIT